MPRPSARSTPATTTSADAAAPEKDGVKTVTLMNTGTRHGCYTIAAPDGTRFTPNDEVRYVDNNWTKAQVAAGILEYVE